jgi:spore germination protein GerM
MKAYVAFVLGCGLLFFINACEERQQPAQAGKDVDGVQATRNGKVVLHLYFGDQEGGYLTAEDRVVAQPADTTALGGVIVDALIDGPRKALTRTIPEGTALRAFHLVKNGTAYVDLSKEIRENHTGGAKSELMTVYSLVNSIVLNVTEVDTVKILIDGQEATTLAGHIDLRYPFKANMLLIR